MNKPNAFSGDFRIFNAVTAVCSTSALYGIGIRPISEPYNVDLYSCIRR